MFFLKKIKNTIKKILESSNQIATYFILKKHKVDFKLNTIFKIYGIPYIRNSGTFILGNIGRINSKYSPNPIGGNTFSTFVVRDGARLVIDDGVGISNSTIFCVNSIYIGKNVFIGGDCKIYDTDFHSLDYKKRISDKDDDIKTKPVIIEEGAFIGTGTIILKGVTIGAKSVIGAGSVVTKSIPSKQIWGGNPARFIRNLD